MIHVSVNHANFSITKFDNFLQQVVTYVSLNKVAETLHGKKEYDASQAKYKEADALNNRFNKDLNIWQDSRKNGGNNPSGMRKRYSIVKERCLE